MSTAREQILGNLRKALGRGHLSPDREAQLDARLSASGGAVIPARGRVEGQARITAFCDEAARVGTTVARVPSSAAAPAAAETGTLVLASGPESPTTLNFLPDTHIAVLLAETIVGAYEATWSAVRAADGPLPRVVNWITGPSRTADIEQTLLIGIHGPRRQHIVLIDGQDT